jgi:LAO/AO transport system kinase
MVDFFLLLMLAGAGDELQGIKRGIMELADTVVINKSDGANESAAKAARSEYAGALHVFSQRPDQWQPRVLCTSGLTGLGLTELWSQIEAYFVHMQLNGALHRKRTEQELLLFEQLLTDLLQQQFFADSSQKEKFTQMKLAIASGNLLAYEAIVAFTDIKQ